MKLLFHRACPLKVTVQKPEGPRAFVFAVQVGLGKNTPQAVDPLSGMLVSLVRVDEILNKLDSLWAGRSWGSLSELLQASWEFLQAWARQENVILADLVLAETRGFWLRHEGGGRPLLGREVFRELGGELYRLRLEGFWAETRLETQDLQVNDAEELSSESLFQKNPALVALEVEKLGSAEAWSLAR